MSKLKLIGLSCMLALAAFSGPAFAQYMYLDANGDSVSTSSDRLNSAGATVLTIYLNTNHDRDGSLQSCNSHTAACGATTTSQPLDMFSYTISLVAVGGTVQWGTFTPANAAYAANGTDPSDDTSIEVNRLRPAGTLTPPGLSILGSIPVTILSGTPRIDIAHSSIAANPFGFGTGFGTSCDGFNLPHTYALGDPANPCGSGGDWFDVDGANAPNLPPTISAPSFVNAEGGGNVTIFADVIDSLSQSAPSITVEGYPAGLSLAVTPVSTNASRASLSGHLGTSDAGSYTIIWAATDQGGLTTNSTTVMNVSSPQASCAAIVGYTTLGPGPFTITEGTAGIDATIGPWGGPLYPNGPCGEPVSPPATSFSNRLRVEIDVGCGGKVGFTYRLSSTGTAPGNGEFMNIQIIHGSGTKTLLWHWGNPQFCWGNVWQSSRIAMIANLSDYANQHIYLDFIVTGNANFGTETQARIQSLAITDCPVPSLAPLAPDDQQLEDQPWDEAHLIPAMQTDLNNFRNAVQNTPGGSFDTTNGSAYRTLGYQLHLSEVWKTYQILAAKPTPECQFLWTTIQYEKGPKHHLAYRPGRVDRPGAIQHTKGAAFDANVTLPAGLDLDTMAAQFGLRRPYKDPTLKGYDPVHFELIP